MVPALQQVVRHALELYAAVGAVEKPADYQIGLYFKRESQLDHNDRGLIAESIYGALRRGIALAEIARAAGIPEPSTDGALLFLAMLEQRLASRADLSRAFAAEVGLAERDLARLATFYASNRDLGFVDGPPLRAVSLRHSFPVWVTELLARSVPLDDIAKLYDGLNEPPPLCLRANTLKVSTEALRMALSREQVTAHPGRLSPFAVVAERRGNIFSLEAFKRGLFEVQDEGSQVISILLNPKPTARVLDACAGAGGKTLHLAALMKGRGEVFAFDTDARRLANIHRRIARAGAQNVRVLDAAERFDAFAARYRGALDCVLIDAPCTGLGTVRRNPDIKLRATPGLVREMTLKQAEILESFSGYVRAGGRVLYATCSILPAENEEIVDAFLSAHGEFMLVPVAEVVHHMRVDFDLGPLTEACAGTDTLRLVPHVHGTDGFFAAVLERRA